MTTTHVQDGCIYTPPYMVYVISIAGTYVEYLTLYRVSGILYTQHLDGGHPTTPDVICTDTLIYSVMCTPPWYVVVAHTQCGGQDMCVYTTHPMYIPPT